MIIASACGSGAGYTLQNMFFLTEINNATNDSIVFVHTNIYCVAVFSVILGNH